MGANFRYNQFTDTKNFVNQTGEIRAIPSSSPYVVRLDEIPDKDSGVALRILDFLATAITDAAATSITVANGAWYSVGDIITVDSEQMTVSAIASNTLTVTRGANSTVATTHVIATKIYIESSMIEVAASPSERQFWPDYSTGADSDNEWNTGTILFNEADAGKLVSINYTKTGSLAVVAPFTSYPHWFYDRGDGSDGEYVPTASTTLAGGTYNFLNVYIPAGVTITLMGCVEIKCLGAFICAGIITANGANGVSDTSNSVASCAGGGGCNGYLTNKGGDSTVAGSPGYGGGVGGASGAAPNIGAVAGGSNNGGSVLDLLSPITNKNYLIADKRIICGGGGGGAPGSPAYAMYGGGGGGGGASIYITAHNANVSGGITANGGNGGAGYNSGNVYDRSGGGGGGGGGAVVIVADTISNTGTITANGGTGGAQTNNSSYVGVAGSNGIVYLKELGAA